MKKRILSLALVVAMVALVAAGSLAYFTDTDADVNVMTTGKVSIDQIEKFDENTILLPAPKDDYGSVNHITKDVSVKNTGNVDAYVRTLYAIEDTWDICGMVHVSWSAQDIAPKGNNDWVQFKATVTNAEDVATETIYTVRYVIQEDALEPEDVVEAGMNEIWLDKRAPSEWSKYAGENYEVLVLSQAAQADGFESADAALNTTFGEITYNADQMVANWFKPVLEAKYPDCDVTVEVFDYSTYSASATVCGLTAPSWMGY